MSKHALPQQIWRAATREGALPSNRSLRQAWDFSCVRFRGRRACTADGPSVRAHADSHSGKEGCGIAGCTLPASGALAAGRERLVRALRRVRSDRQPSPCPPPALSAPGPPFALCCMAKHPVGMFATGQLLLCNAKQDLCHALCCPARMGPHYREPPAQQLPREAWQSVPRTPRVHLTYVNIESAYAG